MVNRYNDKVRVREHYDRVSAYYRSLWGEHLHHGYWIRGDETKEQAQLQLTEHLAKAASVHDGIQILDVGCGFGASSIYLARAYHARVRGITISSVQLKMATQAAEDAKANVKFLLMDAEEMKFDEPFDLIWSVESIAHFPRRERFFRSAAKSLKPGGTVAIVDWFKKKNLKPTEYRKFIQPIEKSMLVALQTMGDYQALLKANGLRVTAREILNKNCVRTWDLYADMVKDKNIREHAARKGTEFIDFLKSLRPIKAGLSSGNFVLGLMVAKKV